MFALRHLRSLPIISERLQGFATNIVTVRKEEKRKGERAESVGEQIEMDLSESSPYFTLTSLVIAFSGPLLLFSLYVYSKPHLIALFLVSSLSSLWAVIFTATIWKIFENYIPIGFFSVFGSFIQECSRFLLIRNIYRNGEMAYKKSTLLAVNASKSDFKLDELSSSLGAGIGFGLMKLLLIYGNIIEKHIHSSSTKLNFFNQTKSMPDIIGISIIAASFFFLDLVLMPIAFYSEKHKNFRYFSCVFLLRIFATCFMFLNHVEGGFYFTILGIFFVIFLSCNIFFHILPSIVAEDRNVCHTSDIGDSTNINIAIAITPHQ